MTKRTKTQKLKQALREKEKRKNRTPEQREQDRLKTRIRARKRYEKRKKAQAVETPEQRAARLQKEREKIKLRNALEQANPELRRIRLEKEKEFRRRWKERKMGISTQSAPLFVDPSTSFQIVKEEPKIIEVVQSTNIEPPPPPQPKRPREIPLDHILNDPTRLLGGFKRGINKIRCCSGVPYCKFCDTIFVYQKEKRAHDCPNLKCTPGNFICPTCNQELPIKKHRYHNHGGKCAECGEFFSDTKYIKKHFEKEHPGVEYDKKKRSEEEVEEYMRKKLEEQKEVLEKRLTNFAKFTFRYGPKTFICDICHAAFRRQDDLENHMKIHTSAVKFPCEICGKIFLKRERLSYHRRNTHKIKKAPSQEIPTEELEKEVQGVNFNEFSSKDKMDLIQKLTVKGYGSLVITKALKISRTTVNQWRAKVTQRMQDEWMNEEKSAMKSMSDDEFWEDESMKLMEATKTEVEASRTSEETEVQNPENDLLQHKSNSSNFEAESPTKFEQDPEHFDDHSNLLDELPFDDGFQNFNDDFSDYDEPMTVEDEKIEGVKVERIFEEISEFKDLNQDQNFDEKEDQSNVEAPPQKAKRRSQRSKDSSQNQDQNILTKRTRRSKDSNLKKEDQNKNKKRKFEASEENLEEIPDSKSNEISKDPDQNQDHQETRRSKRFKNDQTSAKVQVQDSKIKKKSQDHQRSKADQEQNQVQPAELRTSEIASKEPKVEAQEDQKSIEIEQESSGDKNLNIKPRGYRGIRTYCKYCDTLFPTVQKLKSHDCKFLKCGPKNFICRICFKELSRATFSGHNHDKPLNQSEDSGVDKSNWLTCDFCGHKELKKKFLRKHIFSHIETRCDECGKKVACRRFLRKHMMFIHGIGLRCEVCKVSIESKEELRKHMEEAHGGLPPCSYCGKTFLTKIRLRAHEMRHMEKSDGKGKSTSTTKNLIKCPYCPETFALKQYLNYHLRFHNAGDIFVCEICSKSFATEINLKSHQKSKHDIGVICEVCKEPQKSNQDLKEHMKTHGDFRCVFCGKTYLGPSKLKYHLRLHAKRESDNEERVDCQFCQKSLLPNRMRTHVFKCHKEEYDEWNEQN